MKDIIGVVGFLGSGKNTVGNFLIDNLGYKRDSFAGPLKDAVSVVFGWDREMLEGETAGSRSWREQPDIWWEQRLNWFAHPLAKNHPRFTPRLALQLWGTDVLRVGFFDEIWIASLEYRLKDAERVVVTDCRFPNEIKIIRNMGGKVIRVKRGDEPEWWDTAALANSGNMFAKAEMETLGIHISEWAWIGQEFDAVVENDGTLAQLEERTKWTLQTL